MTNFTKMKPFTLTHTAVLFSERSLTSTLYLLNSTQLKIFIGMSAKLIANGHVQIYKYTEY